MLIYLMGASGAGKDSLMAYVRGRLVVNSKILFSHRYITRPANSGGENHVELSRMEFKWRLQHGLFALWWHSHGLNYGIGIELDSWLRRSMTVVVNGSRDYLAEATERYQGLLPVLIEVSPEILKSRLTARGRERTDEIEKRFERACSYTSAALESDRLIIIENNGRLETAGDKLADLIVGA